MRPHLKPVCAPPRISQLTQRSAALRPRSDRASSGSPFSLRARLPDTPSRDTLARRFQVRLVKDLSGMQRILPPVRFVCPTSAARFLSLYAIRPGDPTAPRRSGGGTACGLRCAEIPMSRCRSWPRASHRVCAQGIRNYCCVCTDRPAGAGRMRDGRYLNPLNKLGKKSCTITGIKEIARRSAHSTRFVRSLVSCREILRRPRERPPRDTRESAGRFRPRR